MIRLPGSRSRAERRPCPSCGYDLQGLRGEHVTCPECGVIVDVSLFDQSPREGWSGCPHYRMLWDPVAVAVCCLVVGALLLASPAILLDWSAAMLFDRIGSAWSISVLTVATAVWAVSLVRVGRRYGGLEGALLSLLCHFLITGYIAGVVLGGAVVASFVFALIEDRWFDALQLFLAVLGSAAFLLSMDLLDRWIGRRSQRRYLRQQSMTRREE